ncbi:hypothetical protein KIN20_006910 [Parelaphostrongylus tenuis]|uniref:Uncharacterized protein n=1 Tax=Parelaphostrongylus tenuis TaxID=148309 RepID=A0AAD5M5M2_PARTN|nr:hypothetical protein KIN20_006910 [Parelaphostrongylus tenuis]
MGVVVLGCPTICCDGSTPMRNDVMTRYPLRQLLLRRSYIINRHRAIKEILLPLLVGITLGYVFGLIVSFDDFDSIDHIAEIKHDVSEATLFFLRCLILVHPEAKKPVDFITAIRDTYGRVCNQTIYFTHSQEIQKKVADQLVTVVDSSSNAFYWNYFKDIVVDASEVPAHWTYVGDEQGFLVIGNLRKLVRNYNHRHAIMFGRIFMQKSILSYVFPFLQYERMSVQSGIVMSASAIKNISKCTNFLLPRATESALLICAKQQGVRAVDPVDEEGMHLFHEKDIKTMIPQTHEGNHGHGSEIVHACCSDYAVSFGQMGYKEIRLTDFASSQWRVFGAGGIEEVNDTHAIDPEVFHNRSATTVIPSNSVATSKNLMKSNKRSLKTSSSNSSKTVKKNGVSKSLKDVH